jgi:hypothetical protein
MKFNIPSYSKMVGIFILVGPLICIIPFYLVGQLSLPDNFLKFFDFKFTGSSIDLLYLIAAPFVSIPVSGVLWWLLALQPDNWLITWIPTILAALGFRYFLNLSLSKLTTLKSRKNFAIYCALLSASVSASTYSLAAFISTQLIKQDLNSHTYVSNLDNEYIAAVFIVGFVLGLIVGFSPKHTPENITSNI